MARGSECELGTSSSIIVSLLAPKNRPDPEPCPDHRLSLEEDAHSFTDILTEKFLLALASQPASSDLPGTSTATPWETKLISLWFRSVLSGPPGVELRWGSRSPLDEGRRFILFLLSVQRQSFTTVLKLQYIVSKKLKFYL